MDGIHGGWRCQMNNIVKYPTAPRSDSFEIGLKFQDFVTRKLAATGLYIQNYGSKKYQYEYGENQQGFEIKYDELCTKTYRLSIEVAEKVNAANKEWVPSGIDREDNSWLYIQGNYDLILIFGKIHLKQWCKLYSPKFEIKHGTIKTFYLEAHYANELALCAFEFEKGILHRMAEESRKRCLQR